MNPTATPDALSKRALLPILYAFYACPVLFLVPLVYSLGTPEEEPPVFAVVIIALWLSGAYLVAETFGYRTAALSKDLPPAEAARLAGQRFRVTLLLRLAVTESPILGALAFSFVFGNIWIYVFAFVLGLPMMAFATWPGTRTIEKARGYLEADGARSYLPS